MIAYNKHILSNGIVFLHHYDGSTPFVVVNTMYNIGAKHEDENRTGFAHLFEHLMFGGSTQIPDFDDELQIAGGENNAFTNNDFTLAICIGASLGALLRAKLDTQKDNS